MIELQTEGGRMPLTQTDRDLVVPDNLMELEDALKLLHMSRATFYRHKKEGIAPQVVRLGKKNYIHKEILEAYIRKISGLEN